jgi:large subunit ribosomal protein L13
VEISAQKMFERKPENMVRAAVLGMLPKNKLGKAMGRKLMIYRDDNHPHQAQKPQTYPLRPAK